MCLKSCECGGGGARCRPRGDRGQTLRALRPSKKFGVYIMSELTSSHTYKINKTNYLLIQNVLPF